MERFEKIDFLVSNLNGIGAARAELIVDNFAECDEMLEIVNAKDAKERLSNVLKSKLADSVFSQLKKIYTQDQKVRLMVECGVPYIEATAVAASPLQMAEFEKNPYVIGKNADFSFVACDNYGHKYLDDAPDLSLSRMVFFMEAMMRSIENSGHTFAYLKQLTAKMNAYQEKHGYTPSNYTASVLLLYFKDITSLILEKNTDDVSMWKVYRKETESLETDIAYHIKRLATNTEIFHSSAVPNGEISYDQVQMSAIESAKSTGLKIITGPPGSGKTAVINGIIRYFKTFNPGARILLCAPTGRAAKHMTEITGQPSYTIHKMLGISKDVRTLKKDKLACDMIICDESSMLNLEVAYALLSHIPTGASVYFVGDKDQLPAVGPGNVLHDIINSNTVPVYHLTKVYRQDGIILENAHCINAGKVPEKTSDVYQNYEFQNEEDLRDKAISFFTKCYSLNEPFETQILIPSYKRACGIIEINKAIQAMNPEPFIYKTRSINGYSYKKNDKILMIKNSKDGLYQNGSVGIILAVGEDEIIVSFDDEKVKLPKDAINDMSLGYAVSVHKSQGSEYKNVILCLPSQPTAMLKRNIFYTAVTRAKSKIFVLSMPNTIETAVKTSANSYTQTTLTEKLLS